MQTEGGCQAAKITTTGLRRLLGSENVARLFADVDRHRWRPLADAEIWERFGQLRAIYPGAYSRIKSELLEV